MKLLTAAPMMRRTRVVTVLAAAAFTLLASACSSDNATAQGQRPETAAASLPEVLATIGGERVTLDEVRARAGDDLDQLDVQYRRARDRIVQNALESLVRERVLGAEAARLGRTLEQLVATEAGGSLEPAEADVANWFRENEARLGGRKLTELRPQIADLLRTERRERAMAALEARLGLEREVVIHFEPFRVAFDLTGAPSLGSATAPVTVVEFSDFQCPYCRTFFPQLYRLEREFRGQVRIVFLQFPLTSIHQYASQAGEASLCAHEQGKFWAMHDVLFQEQQRLGTVDLKEKARRIGLAGSIFDNCLDSGRNRERVQAELKQGTRVGVSGTPALFINGSQLEGGAVPYEALADGVRRELTRLSR